MKTQFKVNNKKYIFEAKNKEILFYPQAPRTNEWGDEFHTELTEDNQPFKVFRKVLELLENYVFTFKPHFFMVKPAYGKSSKRLKLYKRLIQKTKILDYYYLNESNILMFYRKI